jgi:large subunit ribosomal protein L10
MKTRKQKEVDVEKLHQELAHISTVILSTFQGVNVEQETLLRRTVETVGGHYRVVKNSVAERAAAGTPAEGLLKGLAGANSISFTEADPVALAKVLSKVAKEIPALEFKAGAVEGRVISVEEVVALASLPSKDELISRIMFLVQSPIQRLAQALAGTSRNMAVVANEAVKAEKFSQ